MTKNSLRERYEAPQLFEQEIAIEGLLCESTGQGGAGSWDENVWPNA